MNDLKVFVHGLGQQQTNEGVRGYIYPTPKNQPLGCFLRPCRIFRQCVGSSDMFRKTYRIQISIPRLGTSDRGSEHVIVSRNTHRAPGRIHTGTSDMGRKFRQSVGTCTRFGTSTRASGNIGPELPTEAGSSDTMSKHVFVPRMTDRAPGNFHLGSSDGDRKFRQRVGSFDTPRDSPK